METFAPHKALDEIFKVIQRANKYIDENAPWALAKDMETNGKRLAHVLYNLLEATRICGILLTPFMPESCEKLFAQIGAPAESRTWDAAAEWGALPETAAVTKGENLFPRLDMDKALEELEAAEAAAKKGRPARRRGGAPADGEGGFRHLLQVRFPGGEGEGLRCREEE